MLVIDGTWRTADSVYKRSVTLHGLMQVKFMPEKVSRFIIKRQPRKECLSTIEAVHSILDLLDKSGIERLDGRHMTLIDSLEKIVKYQSQFMQSRRRRS